MLRTNQMLQKPGQEKNYVLGHIQATSGSMEHHISAETHQNRADIKAFDHLWAIAIAFRVRHGAGENFRFHLRKATCHCKVRERLMAPRGRVEPRE